MNLVKKNVRNLILLLSLSLAVLISPVGLAATYTYDDLGRLTSVVYDNGYKIDYIYDDASNVSSMNNHWPLVVQSTNPSNGSIDIPVNNNIEIVFNREIVAGGNYSGITLKTGETSCPFNATISGSIITLDPTNDFSRNTIYKVTLPLGCVKGQQDEAINGDYSFTFTSHCLRVANSNPENKAAGVALNQTIELSFNSPIKSGGLDFIRCTLVNEAGKNAPLLIPVINGSKLTIDPSFDLEMDHTYTLTVPAAAVKEKSTGDPLPQNYLLTFTTWSDKVPPAIASTTPANDDVNVALNSNITVNFSEPVKSGSNYLGIKLKDNNGNVKLTTNSLKGTVLTINPITKLSANTTYTLFIPAQSVKDQASNYMEKDYTCSFSTATN